MNKPVVGLLALLAWRQLIVVGIVVLLLIAAAPQIIRSVPPVMGIALLAAIIADPWLRRVRHRNV